MHTSANEIKGFGFNFFLFLVNRVTLKSITGPQSIYCYWPGGAGVGTGLPVGHQAPGAVLAYFVRPSLACVASFWVLRLPPVVHSQDVHLEHG